MKSLKKRNIMSERQVAKLHKNNGTMSKSELAHELYPTLSEKSALNALRRNINLNEELLAELATTFYNPKCHTLTQKQVYLIRKHLVGIEDYECQ